MTRSGPRIAIIGAGLGGPVAASLLQSAGFDVKIYEQAQAFTRLGAGIHVTPNVVRILQRIGVGQRLAEAGVRPAAWISRKWDTGEILVNHPLGDEAETRYGAPYLTVHRGDFHALLIDAVEPGTIQFGKRLVDLDQSGNSARLEFADGTEVEADVVIGADGVRSRLREVLIGLEPPRFTRQVAHRSIFPVSRLRGLELDDFTRWTAEDRAFLHYFITSSRDEIYFVARSPEPDWPHQGSWVPGDLDALRAAFEGFHPQVRRILDACTEASKWAIFEGDALALWSRGRVVLLGDACHPMTPNIGQGAAMAVEDAAMLARCIEASPADFDYAFRLY